MAELRRGIADRWAGEWPKRRTDILDWLVLGTRSERFLDAIFVEFCLRLRDRGVPVARSTLHLRTNHPQWLGTRFLWRVGLREAETQRFDYGVTETEAYRNSPAGEIHDGAARVRKRLDLPESEANPAPVYAGLRAEGLTDYVAWPVDYTLGKRNVVTFATDRPGGFAEAELDLLADLLPAFSLVTEVRLKNALARLMLKTYVGPHASGLILDGATTRGRGTTVEAAIMVVDLRGFTGMSEVIPRDEVISLLNDFFDAVSGPIDRHGGEILKFMGDGLLATFPLGADGACPAAFSVAREATQAMLALNQERLGEGLDALGYGIGMNVGSVMYGNIGSLSRLDFTVIGPAVNVAARLEALTKELRFNALFSGSFAAIADCGGSLVRIGTFPLRGVGEPLEVFALAEEVRAAL